MTRTLCTMLVAFSLLLPSGLRAQQPEAVAPKAADTSGDIFSGTIMQLTDRSLTVVRKVPGQKPVTRQFARDSGTTVEGKLRNKARVTVRYKVAEDGGFLAVHIIVR